jgi:hypothetical protein
MMDERLVANEAGTPAMKTENPNLAGARGDLLGACEGVSPDDGESEMDGVQDLEEVLDTEGVTAALPLILEEIVFVATAAAVDEEVLDNVAPTVLVLDPPPSSAAEAVALTEGESDVRLDAVLVSDSERVAVGDSVTTPVTVGDAEADLKEAEEDCVAVALADAPLDSVDDTVGEMVASREYEAFALPDGKLALAEGLLCAEADPAVVRLSACVAEETRVTPKLGVQDNVGEKE